MSSCVLFRVRKCREKRYRKVESSNTSCLEVKNGNFKTRDSSPLIKRVLAGVLVPLIGFLDCRAVRPQTLFYAENSRSNSMAKVF